MKKCTHTHTDAAPADARWTWGGNRAARGCRGVSERLPLKLMSESSTKAKLCSRKESQLLPLSSRLFCISVIITCTSVCVCLFYWSISRVELQQQTCSSVPRSDSHGWHCCVLMRSVRHVKWECEETFIKAFLDLSSATARSVTRSFRLPSPFVHGDFQNKACWQTFYM